MNKIKFIRRGFNSRRPFRKLNSVSEIAGKEVEVMDEDTLVETKVDEVVINKSGDVTLNLENGDEVDLEDFELEELMETGEVTAGDNTTVATVPEDFTVTRDVEDADGNVSEVTTTVSADNEADAIQTVSQLDSRRNRNSRNYRAQIRQTNSDTEERVVDLSCGDEFIARLTMKGSKLASIQVKKTGQLDDKFVPVEIAQIGTEVLMKDLQNVCMDAAEAYRKNNCDATGPKEFKVVRNSVVDGKKVRKIASVTAPTLEEAIEAVKANDTANEIEADGYEELVEQLPESTVQINSDVDEVIEEPAPVVDPEPTPDPTPDPEPEPSPSNDPDPTPDPDPEPEVDRESNSFKGVSTFVERKYGITL